MTLTNNLKVNSLRCFEFFYQQIFRIIPFCQACKSRTLFWQLCGVIDLIDVDTKSIAAIAKLRYVVIITLHYRQTSCFMSCSVQSVGTSRCTVYEEFSPNLITYTINVCGALQLYSNVVCCWF